MLATIQNELSKQTLSTTLPGLSKTSDRFYETVDSMRVTDKPFKSKWISKVSPKTNKGKKVEAVSLPKIHDDKRKRYIPVKL